VATHGVGVGAAIDSIANVEAAAGTGVLEHGIPEDRWQYVPGGTKSARPL
jgi:hypothetical protein